MHADHLTRDARLDEVFDAVEQLTRDRDRSKLGEIHPAVAAHRQAQGPVLRAVQLYFELIARTEHVVGRHRNVGDWRERRRRTLEQLVPEGLQSFAAGLLQRQERQADIDIVKGRHGLQAQRGLVFRQAQQGNARKPRQREHSLLRELIGIAITERRHHLAQGLAVRLAELPIGVGVLLCRLRLATGHGGLIESLSGGDGALKRLCVLRGLGVLRQVERLQRGGERPRGQTKIGFDDDPVPAVQDRNGGLGLFLVARSLVALRWVLLRRVRTLDALALASGCRADSGAARTPSELPQYRVLLLGRHALEDLHLVAGGQSSGPGGLRIDGADAPEQRCAQCDTGYRRLGPSARPCHRGGVRACLMLSANVVALQFIPRVHLRLGAGL